MIFILYYLLHMKMKKLLLGAFLWIFTLAGLAILPNYTNAQDNTNTNGGETFKVSWAATPGSMEKQNLGYNPDVPGAKDFQRDNLIKTVQRAINWVLWILSFVALVLCLYGGFLMMTSGGDSKKYEK